jgi:DNA-3-methyladenine glycosylase I
MNTINNNDHIKRCGWVTDDPLYIIYHDTEWGKPTHDDHTLFEFLVLESAQAGLSWITILRKRDSYRKAYDGFDPLQVAKYDEIKIQELMDNKAIIRNRRKIMSSINNAQQFIKVQLEYGSFDHYIWQFTDGKTLVGEWEKDEDVPCETTLSAHISKDMKKRSFTFIGPTIIYSYLQAIGMVNDHLCACGFKR